MQLAVTGRARPQLGVGQVAHARDVMLFEDRSLNVGEAPGILLATEQAGRPLGHFAPSSRRPCGVTDRVFAHRGTASFLVGFVLKLAAALKVLKNLRAHLKLATADLDPGELAQGFRVAGQKELLDGVRMLADD